MSPYAPRVTTIKVPVDKIGEVIGPKGKIINAITEETGAQISIEDDGTVFVGAIDGPSAQAAIDKINAIANPQLPKTGERFLGTVVKTTDFGAFVSLLPGRDGLVHISKLGRGKRIAKVEDVVNVGDKLRVEIADIDKRGKISLVLVAEEAGESGDGDAASPAPETSPPEADSSASQRAGQRPASSPTEADAAAASS
jgi:polyribonucleotide nucleotidyltransferase